MLSAGSLLNYTDSIHFTIPFILLIASIIYALSLQSSESHAISPLNQKSPLREIFDNHFTNPSFQYL